MTAELQNPYDISIHQIGPALPSITPGVKETLEFELRNHGERECPITLSVVAPDFPPASITIDWRNGTAVFPDEPQSAYVTITLPTNPAQPPVGIYPLEIHASSGGQELANTRINMSVEITAQFEVTLRDIAQNGQKADWQLHIQNNSNAPLKMSLGNAEPASQLTFELDSSEVPPAKPGQAKVTVQPKVPVTQERTDEVRMWLKASAVDKDGKEHPAPEQPNHHLSAPITWKPLGPALLLSVVEPLPDELAPGASSVLKLKIRNQSGVPHDVRLIVVGDGSDWFRPPSAPVKVGAHGGEQAVEIPIRVPPERNHALAGNYALKVQAASQTDPQAKADAPMTIRVKRDGEATITPELHAIKDDQTAEYQLSIKNDTNARLTLSRSASQTDTSHEFHLDPAKIEVSPKETGKTMHLTVKRAEARTTDKFTFAMRREFQRLRDNPAIDVQHVSADWPQRPQLTITQPREQEHVPREIILRGTFQNVPISMHMWLYVYAAVAKKYWLKKVSTDDPSGIWEAQNVGIGSSNDFGESFNLGVILANSAANAQLEAQSDGLEKLPDGVQRFHQITVIRGFRLDDAIPEMVAFLYSDFRGLKNSCKGSKFQQSAYNLLDNNEWRIYSSFIITSGFWCIWPGGPWETFEILGPGEYKNKGVCRCRAIPTQGIILFDGTYFSGKMINLTHSEPNLGQSHDFNDKASSAFGATGNWRLYEHANYEGKWWSVKEGYGDPNFSNNGLNDLISSVL